MLRGRRLHRTFFTEMRVAHSDGSRKLRRHKKSRGYLETPALFTQDCSRNLHPARNIHLLVDAFSPGLQYHPRQPYMKEDDQKA